MILNLDKTSFQVNSKLMFSFIYSCTTYYSISLQYLLQERWQYSTVQNKISAFCIITSNVSKSPYCLKKQNIQVNLHMSANQLLQIIYTFYSKYYRIEKTIHEGKSSDSKFLFSWRQINKIVGKWGSKPLQPHTPQKRHS